MKITDPYYLHFKKIEVAGFDPLRGCLLIVVYQHKHHTTCPITDAFFNRHNNMVICKTRLGHQYVLEDVDQDQFDTMIEIAREERIRIIIANTSERVHLPVSLA